MAENYDGNPLIQAIDAKRKAAEEAAAAIPRVISIATRQPYEGKSKRRRKPKGPPIDDSALGTLAEVADLLADGTLGGALVICRQRAGGFFVRICLPPEIHPQEAAGNFVAPIELLKSTMLDVAQYGLEAVTEGMELEDE